MSSWKQERSAPKAEASGTLSQTTTTNLEPKEYARPVVKAPKGRQLFTLKKSTILDGMHQDSGIQYWIPEDRIERLKKLGVI
jgi:hypothetical protein